ncbi:ricin-type beta-trefoil lectin domain protein [Streptomyces sp. NPDC001795]|uniref:ricin-type beta-trefoil lectin domain protein n=1 Tax=unclassified Streptomyces TaxID=2593676 RepID=UPI0033202772
MWDCNGGAHQIFTRTSAGQLTVYSGASQLCPDAYNNQTAPGTKVQTWTCTGGATNSGASTPTTPSPACNQACAWM